MREGEKEVQGKSEVTDQKGHGVSHENCPTASGFPPLSRFFAECLSQLTWPSLAQVQGLVCSVSEFAALPGPRAFAHPVLFPFRLWPGSRISSQVGQRHGDSGWPQCKQQCLEEA